MNIVADYTRVLGTVVSGIASSNNDNRDTDSRDNNSEKNGSGLKETTAVLHWTTDESTTSNGGLYFIMSYAVVSTYEYHDKITLNIVPTQEGC